MKTLKIITTVGTSIFENYRQTFLNKKFKNIDDAVDNLKDLKAEEINENDVNIITLIGDDEEYGIQKKFFKGFVVKKEKKWISTEDKNQLNIHASAEISSILKIYEEQKKQDEKTNFKVQLLASDTVLSILAAKLIKEWFEQAEVEEKYPNIEVVFNDNVKSPNADYIENLRTDLDKENIYSGFNNLIEKIIELSKENKKNTIVNITGGYKGFIPILTIIAQLEGLKINYIYEDSDNLIEIGNLPIDFDWAFVEAIGSYLEEKAINALFKKTDNKAKKIQNLLLDYLLVYKTTGGTYKLTALGTVLHKYIFLPNKSQISNTVLGSYIELKYYHLFNENYLDLPYSKPKLSFEPDVYYKYNGKEIEIIENSKNGYKKIGDIDLLLRNEDNKLVFCEIKSEREFIKYDVEKAKARLDYQNKKNNAEKPVEYLFIIWKSKFFVSDNTKINNEIYDKIRELCTNLDVVVNVYIHELKLKDSVVHISYGSLLKEKIKKEDFIKIEDFECNNKK